MEPKHRKPSRNGRKSRPEVQPEVMAGANKSSAKKNSKAVQRAHLFLRKHNRIIWCLLLLLVVQLVAYLYFTVDGNFWLVSHGSEEKGAVDPQDHDGGKLGNNAAHSRPPPSSSKTAASRTAPPPSHNNNNLAAIQQYLDAANCTINGKDAISAITRAKSPYCKSKIAELACLTEGGDFYPKQLPNSCPVFKAATFSEQSHIGCFQDSFSERALKGKMTPLKANNTRQLCFEICSQWGYAYSGVQYGHECFCGNRAPPPETLLASDKCNHKCAGDKTQFCGGYLTMNVFRTRVEPFKANASAASAAVKGGEGASPPAARIVYLLTVSGRAVRQVKRLIKRLYDGRNYFYIHVDSRQDYLYRELKPLEAMFPHRIYVTPKRWATIWGGASLLSMLMGCMTDLLRKETWDWDFVLNLSESDYPLKTSKALVDFLTKNRGRNFVKSHGLELDRFIKKQGLDRTFFECESRMWRVGQRALPLGIQVDGGSDWICLDKEFTRFLVDDATTDPLLVGLKPVYQHSLLPAESYFHTVLRNSRFCQTYVNNNLHLTNWRRDRGCKCQHKKVVDWCGCSPNDLLPQDWNRINNTFKKEIFFGRKFEPSISLSILDMVDQWIEDGDAQEQQQQQQQPSRRYWQNIYHHLDSSPAHDTAVLHLATQLSRHAVAHLLSWQDGLSLVKVDEVTSYHKADDLDLDQLAGIVVSWRAEHAADGFAEYEALVELRADFGQAEIEFRNARFSVGTHFDPKELIFRNHFNAMGAESQPEVKYSLDKVSSSSNDEDDDGGNEQEDPTFSSRILFVDPRGLVAGQANLTYTNSSAVSDVIKPSLTSPLQHGIWTVLFFDAEFNNAITKAHFLVVNDKPQLFSGKEQQSPSSRTAASSTVSSELQQSVTYAIETDPVASQLLRLNSNLDSAAGTDSKEEMEAVKHFYEVRAVCVKHPRPGQETEVDPCMETEWSTLFPDPKSSIASFDDQTGRLV